MQKPIHTPLLLDVPLHTFQGLPLSQRQGIRDSCESSTVHIRTAGSFLVLHHGVLHQLLPAGEDPTNGHAPVWQGVHEGGVGVRQQGLEQPTVIFLVM